MRKRQKERKKEKWISIERHKEKTAFRSNQCCIYIAKMYKKYDNFYS